MSFVDKILAELDRNQGSMTCTRIARATGIPSVLVYNYMPRLCKAGRARPRILPGRNDLPG